MVIDSSVVQYFLMAGPIVKLVMFILFVASFVSWVFIFHKWFYFRDKRKSIKSFEDKFYASDDLNFLYDDLITKKHTTNLEKVFLSGFKEFIRLSQNSKMHFDAIIKRVKLTMRVEQMVEEEDLEKHLPFLATVGSVSPYVGLFGTVWGIMMAFQALGHVQQATIAMVAPGISEALIATAMGLFAAIPAVIAYNRYTSSAERILNRYDMFEDMFVNSLHRFEDI